MILWNFANFCTIEFSQNCHDESMKDKRLSFIPNLNETYYNFFQNKLPDIENVGDHIGENDNLDEITKLSKHVLIPPRNAQEWKANRYGLCIKYIFTKHLIIYLTCSDACGIINFNILYSKSKWRR